MRRTGREEEWEEEGRGRERQAMGDLNEESQGEGEQGKERG